MLRVRSIFLMRKKWRESVKAILVRSSGGTYSRISPRSPSCGEQQRLAALTRRYFFDTFLANKKISLYRRRSPIDTIYSVHDDNNSSSSSRVYFWLNYIASFCPSGTFCPSVIPLISTLFSGCIYCCYVVVVRKSKNTVDRPVSEGGDISMESFFCFSILLSFM